MTDSKHCGEYSELQRAFRLALLYMDAPLCPRCGADTSWFAGAARLPYCNDCGWNLDEVYQGHQKHDRLFSWLICGFAVLICIPVIIHNPRRGILLLGGVLALAPLLILSVGRSKTTLRLKATREAVTQKPGSDLSSTAPIEMPPRVATYGEALRAIPRPRQIRLIGVARAAIGMVRAIAGVLALVAIRDLLFPHQRITEFSDALLPIGLLFLAFLLWFLVPIPLRKELRRDLLVNGEVVVARMAPIPPWWRGERISFEFRDANGRLIRGQSVNQGHAPAAGAYVPVFYDAQNPENCAPACALNYDLVVPEGFARC
jgi:hypothetical protein